MPHSQYVILHDEFVYDEETLPSTHPIAIVYPDGAQRMRDLVGKANRAARYEAALRNILGYLALSNDRGALLDRIRDAASVVSGDA